MRAHVFEQQIRGEPELMIRKTMEAVKIAFQEKYEAMDACLESLQGENKSLK